MGITREIDTHRLAMLPITYVVEQEDMFDGCCKEGGLDPDYRDVFTTGTWAYQLYIFRTLVCEYLGYKTAQKVWKHQCRALDHQAGAGLFIEHAMDLIEHALHTGRPEAPMHWADVNTPAEMDVALALLLGMPESPLFSDGPQNNSKRVSGQGAKPARFLTDCLSRGRDRILCLFDLMLTRPAGEDPRSL